jgi:hypothetical protein
MMECLLEM